MRFLVLVERTCPQCQGAGVVVNPLWERFLEEEARVDPSRYHLWALEFWSSAEYRYPDELPPEEEECSRCRGAGVLREEVPLEEALRALGLL